MERIEIDGIDIAYRTAGEGRPILLIHGFTGNARNWALTIKPLTSAGWKTLTPDNPGHGESAGPDQAPVYSMASMATRLHALSKQLGWAPAVVAGHSMGGAIAEEYAAQYPDDVEALILIGSAGGGPRPDEGNMFPAEALQRAKEIAGRDGMAALWDAQVQSGQRVMPENMTPELREITRSEFAKTSLNGYVHCAAGMRQRRNTAALLSSWSKPALIIRGATESAGLTYTAEELAKTLPGSRYEIIDGAGHTPQLENPAAFNAVVLDFLSRV